ncbi:MAG: M56 family metallopeptidase [Gemmatimonadota bacterium]
MSAFALGLDAMDPELARAADIGLRATALLAIAVASTWALRRRAADARHALWTATFVLLLALPVAVSWAPALTLAILPAPAPEAPAPAIRSPEGHVTPIESVTADAPRRTEVAPALEYSGAPASNSSSGQWWLAQAMLFLWGAGVLAALASVGVGVRRFHAQVRDATPIRDASWRRRVDSLRERLRVRGDVGLLASDSAATPMTGGWLRPVILLPESAHGWSSERRDVVLAHEMIHVRRRDALRQVLGRVALALYWFHPLSWVASRLSAASREQACDDGVLALGTRPSEYAAHLIELAERAHRAPAVLALPMVQRSQLERRVMAILDPRRRRLSVPTTALVVLVLGAFSVPAAIARPVPAQPPAVAVDGPGELPPAPEHVELTRAAEPTATVTVKADAAGPAVAFEPPPAVQEIACDVRGVHGDFSGTFTMSGDRHEHSGTYNGDRVIQKFVDDLRLCMRIHGDVVLSDEGTSVRAVGADSWVLLESEEGALRRMVITEGPGGIEHSWSVDGRDQAFDDGAREWRDRMFTVLNGYWEANRIRGRQSSLRGRISSHRGRVSSLRGQISSARGRVSSLNGQISSARGRVSSLKGQISSARGRVSSLKGRISSARGHVSSLRGRISSIRGRMSSLSSAARSTSDSTTRARLEQELEERRAQIRAIEREIGEYDVEGRVAEIQREIDEYDIEGRVAEIQREIDEYDVEGRVAEVRREIDAFDLEGRVLTLEREIEEYDLEGKVLATEREIEELDADRRAAEIEARLAPEIEELRRLIRRL